MTESKDYDVLRLIEYKKICYISADSVKGHSLVGWIKYHPYMKKEKMLQWIHDMIYQLVQIHKCRGNPGYQYVNPYSMVIADDEKIRFLDMNAVSNQGKVNIMNRRNIREQFLPKQEEYYQSVSEELDVYGLGKTIQYLLAFVKAEPDFTRREEKILKKMISKCTRRDGRKRFESMKEIQKDFLKLAVK